MMMMMTYQDGIPMKGGGAGPCPLPSVVRHLVAVSGGASPTPAPASGRRAVNVAPLPGHALDGQAAAMAVEDVLDQSKPQASRHRL